MTKSHKKITIPLYNKALLKNYGYLWFILPFMALPLFTKGVSTLATLSLIIALIIFLKNKIEIKNTIIANPFFLLFLIFIIPICISLIDSLNPKLTMQTIWRVIRFSSYAIIAIVVFRTSQNRNRFSAILFWLLMLYCLDAICQWLFNFNIYGYNPISDAWQNRVRGVFGERYDLSYFLATLSPLVFFFLLEKINNREQFYIYLSPIFIVLFLITIFIGGARTALISLVISSFFFICYCFYHKRFNNLKIISIGITISFICIILIALQSDISLIERMNYSLKETSLSWLTSNRTNLWYVAWTEFPNYWINGVGVRGFDALYQTYPESYKIFEYMNHPHLQGLEVLIETGFIGFLCYIFICLFLLISFLKSKENNPWLLIAFLSMMPINSYAGLYEGNWLPVVLISISLATAFSRPTIDSLPRTPQNRV